VSSSDVFARGSLARVLALRSGLLINRVFCRIRKLAITNALCSGRIQMRNIGSPGQPNPPKTGRRGKAIDVTGIECISLGVGADVP
jgi:hypothetical protein